MENWKRKEEWKREGKNFQVVVSRHEVSVYPYEGHYFDSEGPHRWCVYAYIYPDHQHFANFEGDDMWQDAASVLGMHAGPSLLRWHYTANGVPMSVQVGCDYNHLHDTHYTRIATEAEAYAVFYDANELFDRLQRMDERAAELPLLQQVAE